LTPDLQHHILAVAKEAINNILKHANASRVDIETRFADGVFVLSIRDDGIGFSPEAREHSERNGLGNMRSRMAEIHGTIAISSERGKGTDVTLRVPIYPASTRV
jgi:signal transduction histidine kinase